jgi:hypothetical protein
MTDEIHIPAEFMEPKPWWTARPSAERIAEILNFIQRTGTPHRWPGQTYNRPPQNSPIDYLAEFHLPQLRMLAPCPCCTPHSPKYRHGMIAYFPEEQMIRIIGHDCFKSINSEGHVKALKKYHRDIQQKRDIAYLLDHLGKVPELISVVEQAEPVGHAVDEFRNKACTVFKEVLHLDLWDHIRTGELRITSTRTQIVQIPGQGVDEREVQVTETYGRITGQDFLKVRSPKLGLKLRNVLIGLGAINYGPNFKEVVAEMSDEHRREAARILGKAVQAADAVFSSIHDLRQFTSPATLATLNGWARRKGCIVQMHVTFDGSNLHIGRDEDSWRRIEAPAGYSLVLKRLPSIGQKSVAA